MTPPVAIAVHVPGTTVNAGTWPQAMTSALSVKVLGMASLAPTGSAARIANPSTFERSNGGASTGAITSPQRARVRASASVTSRRGVEQDRGAVRSAHVPLPATRLQGIVPVAPLHERALSVRPLPPPGAFLSRSFRGTHGLYDAHGQGLT